jgi:tryptophan synthase alpha chain
VSRIDSCFRALREADRGAFIPYLTAGDPDLGTTHDIVLAMEEAGADLIELGVPFSDPIADGPVIQRATERALRSGTTVEGILDLVRRLRRSTSIPLVLFSYYNPLLARGLDRLAGDAAEAGVDGLLASDLTVEESGAYLEAMHRQNLDTVFLAAPTSSPERLGRIARATTGFLYAVSRTGVTGAEDTLSTDLQRFLGEVRTHTDLPVVVGFGISTSEQVRAVWREADGAVVGSAIVREIEVRSGESSVAKSVGRLVRKLRGGGS